MDRPRQLEVNFMKEQAFKISDFIIYWSIVIIPFAVAISPAMANAFIGFMTFFYIFKKILNFRHRSLFKTPIDMPFLLIVIFSGLSFINSVDLSNSVHGMMKWVKYAFIFLACAEEIRDIRQVKRIAYSCLFGAALIGLDGIFQLKFGFDFIRGYGLQSSPIDLTRPTASFPNPNIMGIYLSALSPLVIGLALFLKTNKKEKFLFVSAALLAVLGVYLTFSRGSGLGLFFACLFLGIFKRNKSIIASLLVLLLLFTLFMPKKIKDWTRDISYNPLVFLFNQDRLSMYRNTMNMIRHHPFIGVGVNTFSKNYAKYKLKVAEEYHPTPDTTYTHNMYLQMAGEIGLPGFLAFLWLLFRFFKDNLWTHKRLKDHFLQVTCMSLFAGVSAFLINGMTETSLYYSRISMIFWYLIGCSLALRHFVKADE